MNNLTLVHSSLKKPIDEKITEQILEHLRREPYTRLQLIELCGLQKRTVSFRLAMDMLVHRGVIMGFGHGGPKYRRKYRIVKLEYRNA